MAKKWPKMAKNGSFWTPFLAIFVEMVPNQRLDVSGPGKKWSKMTHFWPFFDHF